jgi:hypothetical protein
VPGTSSTRLGWDNPVRAHVVNRPEELGEAVALDPYPSRRKAPFPESDRLQRKQQDADDETEPGLVEDGPDDERAGPNGNSQYERIDQRAHDQKRERIERIEAQRLVAFSGEAREIALRLCKRYSPVKSRKEARWAFGRLQRVIGPTPPTGATLDEAIGVGHDGLTADRTRTGRGRHETGAEHLLWQHSDLPSFEQSNHHWRAVALNATERHYGYNITQEITWIRRIGQEPVR